MYDYHLHTPYCRHAQGSMEQYVERAAAAGLREICFTPHIPLPGFDRGAPWLRMAPADAERYFRELERLRTLERFRGIDILGGIEADFYDGTEKYIEEFLGRYPFDLVLLSVHFIRDWPRESWVFDLAPLGKPIPQIYHEYFEALKRGIRTGLYDSVAHLDLIRQPGLPVLAADEEDVVEVLELVGKAGMSLEINTSGMRRTLATPYPVPEILPLAAAHRVPVITSSDAHEPHLVGYGFREVRGWIDAVPGLQQVRYRGRRQQAAELLRRTCPSGVAT